MIKVVYAEGCSMTSGAEHADWYMTKEGLEYSETTWAGQIKQKCFPNAVYLPTARSASSNSHIRRRSIFYLSQLLESYKGEEIIFLVQYTDISRKEVRVEKIKNTKNYQNYIDKDESLYIGSLPIDLPGVEEFSNPIVAQKDRNEWLHSNNILKYFNEYNLNISNRESSMYSTLTEIETIRNFCKIHNITMYETLAFGELVDLYGPTKTEDKFLIELSKRVDVKNTLFYVNKQGIYDWAKNLNLASGPGKHPLEDAHSHWARMMIKHYKIKRVS